VVQHSLLSAPIINYVGDFLRRKNTQRPSWIGFWLQLIEEIVSSFPFSFLSCFSLLLPVPSSSSVPYLFYRFLPLLLFSSSSFFSFLFCLTLFLLFFLFFHLLPFPILLPYPISSAFSFLVCSFRKYLHMSFPSSSSFPFCFYILLPFQPFPFPFCLPSSSAFSFSSGFSLLSYLPFISLPFPFLPLLLFLLSSVFSSSSVVPNHSAFPSSPSFPFLPV
jgi:hypothetical protein